MEELDTGLVRRAERVLVDDRLALSLHQATADTNVSYYISDVPLDPTVTGSVVVGSRTLRSRTSPAKPGRPLKRAGFHTAAAVQAQAASACAWLMARSNGGPDYRPLAHGAAVLDEPGGTTARLAVLQTSGPPNPQMAIDIIRNLMHATAGQGMRTVHSVQDSVAVRTVGSRSDGSGLTLDPPTHPSRPGDRACRRASIYRLNETTPRVDLGGPGHRTVPIHMRGSHTMINGSVAARNDGSRA